MGKAAFFDVDTQYDFMNPRGKLYVKGAEGIVRNLKKITLFADKCGIPIVSSLDWHLKNDPEFKLFPAHCLRNSGGAKKIKETLAKKSRQVFIHKHTLDVFSNPKTKKVISRFDTVYIYGVALDYCVKAACLGSASLGLKVYLVSDTTKAISEKGRRQTIKELKYRKVKFIKTKDLIKRLSV